MALTRKRLVSGRPDGEIHLLVVENSSICLKHNPKSDFHIFFLAWLIGQLLYDFCRPLSWSVEIAVMRSGAFVFVHVPK